MQKRPKGEKADFFLGKQQKNLVIRAVLQKAKIWFLRTLIGCSTIRSQSEGKETAKN
jgi:hypothetical protein